MTRGECRCWTMCRAKSLFMHDAVNGGSRTFGCAGHRMTRGSCRCLTTSCTKSRFYAVMLSSAAPERSGATTGRWARGADYFVCALLSASAPECSGVLFARRARRADCFPSNLSMSIACLRWLCLCPIGCVPQAFGCIAVPTGLGGNYRLLNDAVA